MNDHTLHPYYLNELSEFRDLSKRFSQEHPHIAHHLQFESGFNQNPQLAQLIESLVFMNARIRYQFEQDYPQFMNTLVDLLYPHLTAPLPSMAIVQWPAEKNLEKGFSVPRGTLLETNPSVMSSARFSTIYTIEVHPIAVTEATLLTDFFLSSENPAQTKAAVRVTIAPSHPKKTLASLDLSELQFHLGGDQAIALPLYEALMRDCFRICVIEKSAEKDRMHWLNADSVRQVGFTQEEALLPHDARTLSGHRLLTEFFAFPQKFLFFKLMNFPALSLQTQQLEILFYLDKKPSKGLFQLGVENFQLGCTPVVNLFPKTVEPLELKEGQHEYLVMSDLRKPQDYEIYQVQHVVGCFEEHSAEIIHRLFSYKKNAAFFWHTERLSCSDIPGNALSGTELVMSITHSSALENPNVLLIDTLCSNRQLTQALLQQTSLPALQPATGNIPVNHIRWVGRLTPPRPSLFQSQGLCLLLQSLFANVNGFTNDHAEQLKNILNMHLQPGKKEWSILIDSIENLSSQAMHAFIHHAEQYGYCQGIKLVLHLQQRPAEGVSAWLLFDVLEKFFADLAPINSFIQFHVATQEEELYQWPLRAGEQTFI